MPKKTILSYNKNGEKECCRCHEFKHPDKFGNSWESQDNKKAHCKACAKKYDDSIKETKSRHSKKKYKTDPDLYKKRAKLYYEKNKEKVLKRVRKNDARKNRLERPKNIYVQYKKPQFQSYLWNLVTARARRKKHVKNVYAGMHKVKVAMVAAYLSGMLDDIIEGCDPHEFIDQSEVLTKLMENSEFYSGEIILLGLDGNKLYKEILKII